MFYLSLEQVNKESTICFSLWIATKLMQFLFEKFDKNLLDTKYTESIIYLKHLFSLIHASTILYK